MLKVRKLIISLIILLITTDNVNLKRFGRVNVRSKFGINIIFLFKIRVLFFLGRGYYHSNSVVHRFPARPRGPIYHHNVRHVHVYPRASYIPRPG